MSRGLVYAITAGVLWGVNPLYWVLLDEMNPVDILGFRICVSAITLALLHTAIRNWGRLRADTLKRGVLRAAIVRGGLIALNWWMFIAAVTSEQVIATALGYYISPLASVVMAVVVLGERLTRMAWCAVGLAICGVVWLTVDAGRLPVLALGIAATFALYGLFRKRADIGPTNGVSLELAVLLPAAIVLVALKPGAFEAAFGHGWGRFTVILTTGVVTVSPLLLFAAATRLSDLNVVGFAQYLVPTLSLLVGVVVLGEPWSIGQAAGFSFIWLGLALFVIDTIRNTQSQAPRAARLAPARSSL